MQRQLLPLIILLLSCLPLATSAQSFFVKAGGGLSTQTGSGGWAGAPKVALGYEYEFNQRWTFAPSIGVVGRGWSVPDIDTPDLLFDEEGNMLTNDGFITTDPTQQGMRPILGSEGLPTGEYYKSLMHRAYRAYYIDLDLPFNYYLRVGESRYVTFTAGPWVAVGFAGSRVTDGDGREPGGRKVRYSDSTFSLDGARRFDCGLKAGIGYQFPSSLTIQLEGEFGLMETNVATEAFNHLSGHNLSIMLTFAYKLNKSKWKEE